MEEAEGVEPQRVIPSDRYTGKKRPSLVASRPFSPGGCAVVSTPGRPWPHQFRFPRLHFVHAQWVYRAAGVARRSGGSSLTG